MKRNLNGYKIKRHQSRQRTEKIPLFLGRVQDSGSLRTSEELEKMLLAQMLNRDGVQREEDRDSVISHSNESTIWK